MWQNVPEQAATTELFAGNDAVCIAAIGATLHDGTKWGWVGDWGMICGIDWYYSGIKVRISNAARHANYYRTT